MKAIAFSIKPHEKESLILSNGKRHDLTLISNELNMRTVVYAAGKEAVIISSYDLLDEILLEELRRLGVTRIITRSKETTHIDLREATRKGFKIANVPYEDQSVENISKSIIRNLNSWGKGKCVGASCCCDKVHDLEIKKKIQRIIFIRSAEVS